MTISAVETIMVVAFVVVVVAEEVCLIMLSLIFNAIACFLN